MFLPPSADGQTAVFCHLHFSQNPKIDKTEEKIYIFTYFCELFLKNRVFLHKELQK